MTTGIIHNDQNLERQIEKHMGGCMAGFFNLFDRNHILSSHHHSPPNRCLPAPTPHRPRPRSSIPSNSSSAVDSSSETVSCLGSPSSRSVQFACKTPQKPPTPPSSDNITTPRTPPPESTSPSSLPVSSVGINGGGAAAKPLSPWKFSREAPRLSLDSRAVVDAKGKLHPREIRTDGNIINILPNNNNNNSSSSPMTPSANRRQSCGDDDSESDSHRRSPSVVARLMGLEPLMMPHNAHHSPNSPCGGGGAAAVTADKRAELRRSASESRSRDLLHYHRFDVDGGSINNNNTTTGFFTSNFNVTTKFETNFGAFERGFTALDNRSNNFTSCRFDARQVVNNNLPQRGSKAPPASAAAHKNHQQPQPPPPSYNHQHHHHHHQMMARKGFYDSGDYFPDIKPPSTSPVYGEIEKRFRTRGGGVDEPSRDLVTLKQIVEALQLKGLLHSGATSTRSSPPPPLPSAAEHQRISFVGDPRGGLSRSDESPIVFMRPAASGSVATRNRSSAGGDVAVVSPGREMPARRPVISPRSPGRNEREREVSSVANAVGTRRNQNQKNQGLSAEKQKRSSVNEKRRGGEAPSSPRMSGGGQPRSASSPRRSGGGNSRSSSRIEIVRAGEEEEKARRGDKEEDGFSTVSESSYFSTSTDTERSKIEDHREGGRSLLERCDKLLHSIAEMNASVTISTTTTCTAELQPSPVSVLDSSFYNYKEEEAEEDQELSPSSLTTAMRTLHFRDQHLGESSLDENSWLQPPLKSSDLDLIYITDIVRASNYLPDDSYSDLFLLLEKHQSLTTTTTKASMIQRRLLFDATTELLDRYQQLPPWKLCTIDGHEALPRDICTEIQRIKPKDGSAAANDLFEVICGVMKKDLDGNSILTGWGRCHVEVSEAVLDIERLIFKDLIGETIQDVAALGYTSLVGSASRRRLVF